MSKRHCCKKEYDGCEKNTFFGLGNCCCDFPTLIILILIILQFNKKGGGFFGGVAPVASGDECAPPVVPAPYFGSHNLIDNSILFIIALFFLSCCNPCRK
jgi:hypothetical protein